MTNIDSTVYENILAQIAHLPKNVLNELIEGGAFIKKSGGTNTVTYQNTESIQQKTVLSTIDDTVGVERLPIEPTLPEIADKKKPYGTSNNKIFKSADGADIVCSDTIYEHKFLWFRWKTVVIDCDYL